MPGNPNKLPQFWQELKRRKVVRVITVYSAAAFVILELVSIIGEPLKLPEWTLAMVIVLLCIGFIIAVILSWIYDITPEGIEKTRSAQKISEPAPEKPTRLQAWKIATYLSAVIIVALVMLHIISRSRESKNLTELEKSIAVLPFRNDSPDTLNQFFIDGTMESIRNNLSKIDELSVIARTSVEQYRSNARNIILIGKALNVSYILEGSGQKYGNKIRLTVQLINAKNGDHIWSRQYDKEIEDIFSIQSEIAQSVASEIRSSITPEVKQRIEKEPTENIEAYNLYLQGRYFYNMEGKEGLDRSLDFYKRALEIDSNYALAYSGMAATFTALATGGYFPRKEVMHLAKETALKALEIDSKLGEAHAELAWARVINDWEWIEGEKGFKRALELNPNYEGAHTKYSWLLSMVGRHDEAIQECKRAHELDPLSVVSWVSLGRRYYFARDYDRAIEEYHKVLEMFPDSEYVRVHLALALSQKGLHDEAIEVFSKIETITSWHWYLGYIYAAAGKKEKALEVLQYYMELSKKQFVWPSNFTFIYAGLNEKDKAFEWLEKTYQEGEAWLDLLQVEPMYDNLRSDPRFQDILDRMNFPD